METKAFYKNNRSLLRLMKGQAKVKMHPEPDSETVEVLTGNKALQLLLDTSFLSNWDLLYNRCTWSSVFQGKSFVTAWYRLYEHQYLPIIVKSEQEGELIGLLTMAKAKKGRNVILVAGAREAHYQVWLAKQNHGATFIKCALAALRVKFPSHDINFYNTPPFTPLTWAREDPFWQRHCYIRAFQRPLMNFNDSSILHTVKSKRFSQKLNQLKKIGTVNFEHITDFAAYNYIIDKLADMFDFRKGAMYNWMEYRNDLTKKEFLKELFKEGLLHVTVLKVNEEIIASITDVLGKDKWVHGTEMATHSCLYAKYSPGILNFILLGQKLMKEDYSVYDLTPGGDFYKARLANGYDQVHELYVSGFIKTLITKIVLEPLRKIVRYGLLQSGLTPKKFKITLKQVQERIRLINPQTLIVWIHETIVQIITTKNQIFKIEPNLTTLAHNIKKNSLRDLLSYDQSGGRMTKWDFLADAMHRLETGEQPYSLTLDGRLLACCWLGKCVAAATTRTNPSSLPKGSFMLYDLYCHTASRDILPEFLENVAGQLAIELGTHDVPVLAKDAVICRVLCRQT